MYLAHECLCVFSGSMVWIIELRPLTRSIDLGFPNLWVVPNSMIGQVPKMGLELF